MTEENWNLQLNDYANNENQNIANKAGLWQMAIGLQAVDGLKPSRYFMKLVKKHLDGQIDTKNLQIMIDNYYDALKHYYNNRVNVNEKSDKVAVKIFKVLDDEKFTFSYESFLNIHKLLFENIYDHAGKIRECNLCKKEWVLNDKSVEYASCKDINTLLQEVFEKEKNYEYQNISSDKLINHLCQFTAELWKVHPFREGNTRTTAVFITLYLKSMGIYVNTSTFAKNSLYFRNALVRANYEDEEVLSDLYYLKLFFSNLLNLSNYGLHNRHMHVDYDCFYDEYYDFDENHKFLNEFITKIKNNISDREERLILRKIRTKK